MHQFYPGGGRNEIKIIHTAVKHQGRQKFSLYLSRMTSKNTPKMSAKLTTKPPERNYEVSSIIIYCCVKKQ